MGYKRREVINSLGDRSIKRILETVNSDRRRFKLNKESIERIEELLKLGYLDKPLSPPYQKENPHDVFICYSSTDKTFARRVANAIAAKDYKVWFDEFEMRPGDSLYEKVQLGIRTSAWFVITLSPDSVESKWCKRELHNAMEEEFERNKVYVIPVLYKQCTMPGFLKEKYYADCQGRRYKKGLGKILDLFSGAGSI